MKLRGLLTDSGHFLGCPVMALFNHNYSEKQRHLFQQKHPAVNLLSMFIHICPAAYLITKPATRPSLSQFSSIDIRRWTFSSVMNFIDQRICRLSNCERVGRVGQRMRPTRFFVAVRVVCCIRMTS